MKLGLLVGNSRLRYGIFDGARIRGSGAFAWDELEAAGFEPLEEIVRREQPPAAVVGCVREERREALERALKGSVPRLLCVGRDFDVPIDNRYDDPREVGVDRLLGALAARELWPGSTVVVLDFGTALSVSVVSREGVFLGGLIGVGIGAAGAALAAGTPVLPEVEAEVPRGCVQRSTADALSAGLFWQLSGGAQSILDALRRELPAPVLAVATGGDAELLVRGMHGVDRIEPDLALRGLLVASRDL